MDRNTFIKKITGAIFINIPFYSILSCSGSDNDPAPEIVDKNCLLNGTVGSVSSNHGHSISVSKADIEAGVTKQYNIQGSSNHSHSVTVSESDFTSLKSNQQIQLATSSGGGHTHSVIISCA